MLEARAGGAECWADAVGVGCTSVTSTLHTEDSKLDRRLVCSSPRDTEDKGCFMTARPLRLRPPDMSGGEGAGKGTLL